MSVWLLTDAAMDAHATPGHPERPERRYAVATGVRLAADVDLIEPGVEEIEDETLAATHEASYLSALAEAEAAGGGWLDPDTYVVPGSLRAARLAAGATAQAVTAVSDGRAEVAFAVVRPPGHHARAERGTGFCLINNAAVAVNALRHRGLARVAIVDWDVHHGDGTQAIFDTDPDLCYTSTHQSPLYPGTGASSDRGVGAAAGTKHNRPLPPGSGDDAFVAAWRDELLPAVESFAPEALIVSAGYDAHAADPLASLAVTTAGFATVSTLVGAVSARLGLPGVALTLEGGYDLDALRDGASATVRGIIEGRRLTLGSE